ncbi:MAG: hypothetical protein IKU62_08190 [Ruminiclostridium sp.]|nr:hypothetical protein [Ruminiclostridium sp.]
MTTLTLLQEAMTDLLTAQGIPSMTAFPKEDRVRWTQPLAVVGVKEVAVTSAAFGDCLGDNAQGEILGQQARVTFRLTLYSPPETGEEGCRQLLDRTAGALFRGSPGGLRLEQWVMGETSFDQTRGMFRADLTATYHGMLAAVVTGETFFLDFAVKGGLTI